MMRTFQYRLRPNATQLAALEYILADSCETYNAALQERRDQSLGSTVPPGSESALREGYYWVWYEGDWIIGNWDGEDWNLANGVTCPSRYVIRGPRIADPPTDPPTSGLPTPDLNPQNSDIGAAEETLLCTCQWPRVRRSCPIHGALTMRTAVSLHSNPEFPPKL
jgi:hypothetical protein